MNHLFDQDRNISTLFAFIQKEHFKYIIFLFFNRIHFNLVPGTASHFKIHVLVTHMHPLQPKEHTVKKHNGKLLSGLQINLDYICIQMKPVLYWTEDTIKR